MEQAYTANNIKEDDDHIIGDADSAMLGEVMIMDKDTGVEQNSTPISTAQAQYEIE